MNGNILRLAKTFATGIPHGSGAVWQCTESLQAVYTYAADGCACAFKASFKTTSMM